jgi:uncharacterized protein
MIVMTRSVTEGSAGSGERARATEAFIRPLKLDLDDLAQSLMPERVTHDSLPDFLKREWLAPDGGWRVEIWPKDTGNNNATVSRFAHAVQSVVPNATGEAVSSIEWGTTIVHAFAEAAALALISIAVLLLIVLRRPTKQKE